MSHYRRCKVAGATYFFTVVAYQRQPILCDETIRNALREAIVSVRADRPFSVDAWVLLPDHLHCIWTLPEDDADFSTRWSMIKRKVSLVCSNTHKIQALITDSKRCHRESTIWQRRFWEHQIRHEDDLARHLDYIHYNPVKHGYCKAVAEWPYSTFHQYVERNIYTRDWGGVNENRMSGIFGE